MIEIHIGKQEENQRLDKFVRKYLSDAPLSFIYRLFRKKDVKVNKHWAKPETIICDGDVVSIYVTDAQLADFQKPREAIKQPLSHPIIFEDENILVVDKPRGLLVHGDASEKRITLANEVCNYLYFKGEYDPSMTRGFIPAPAHRLDRNTSGLVLFAKNLPALQSLESLFKNKSELVKTYQALAVGVIDKPQSIDLPLIKDPDSGLVRVGRLDEGAKRALSEVTIAQRFKDFTLVNVVLVTGKTHQIRVHLAAIKHPVVGDGKYGDFAVNRIFKEKYGFENQFLHATSISFKKIDGVLSYLSGRTFVSPLPKEEAEILRKLS